MLNAYDFLTFPSCFWQSLFVRHSLALEKAPEKYTINAPWTTVVRRIHHISHFTDICLVIKMHGDPKNCVFLIFKPEECTSKRLHMNAYIGFIYKYLGYLGQIFIISEHLVQLWLKLCFIWCLAKKCSRHSWRHECQVVYCQSKNNDQI